MTTADTPTPAPAPSTTENETPLVEASDEANDPGGAHGKGYSADPPGTPEQLELAGVARPASRRRRPPGGAPAEPPAAAS